MFRAKATHGFDEHPKVSVVEVELPLEAHFQFIQFRRQLFVVREEMTKPDESPHDLNVDGYGTFAVEDAGEHGDPLFGEGVGGSSPPAAPCV